MRTVDLGHPKKLLCLGAHADDIEIGAGGTLLKLLANRPDIRVHWVVFSAAGDRGAEARASSTQFLSGCNDADVRMYEFRDGYFPYQGERIKDCFECLKRDISPDLILTHHRLDRHQDHRVIAELTWNTFRDHLILQYEVAKYDGHLPSPNLFVEVDATTCQQKLQIVLDCFQSQRERHWFTAENFQALMRLRAIESNAASGFAEGFHCEKALLSF